MVKIAIINGPNLNLLGTREPDIYGRLSFEQYFDVMKARFTDVALSYYQSNVEGELINYLHNCMHYVQGVIINPGGYSHTSVALADALSAIGLPTVEVHISNIFSREAFRQTSLTAARCLGSISGLGLEGYSLAVHFLVGRLVPEAP